MENRCKCPQGGTHYWKSWLANVNWAVFSPFHTKAMSGKASQRGGVGNMNYYWEEVKPDLFIFSPRTHSNGIKIWGLFFFFFAIKILSTCIVSKMACVWLATETDTPRAKLHILVHCEKRVTRGHDAWGTYTQNSMYSELGWKGWLN